MSEISQEQVISWIKDLTVLELSNFVKKLEDELGVTGAMMMPAGGIPTAGIQGASSAAPVEEKTEFDVILKAVGNEKIKVIKEVRAITSLGLKEAKDFVEGVPKKVKEGLPKEEAEKIKAQLESAGATVEIV